MGSKKQSVVILGGGIAGLTIAWKLAEAGHEVEILERENKVGGLSRTTNYKGFSFDYSAHRFNSDNPEVVKRFKYLIGNHCVKRQKKTLIYLWGKYLTYPPKAFELISTMPIKLLIRSGVEFILATSMSLFRPPKNHSFSDWTRSRFGKTLSLHLNEKYAKKLWKTDPSKLSGDWASTRVGSFGLKDFLLALFIKFAYKKVYSASHPDSEWFYYSDIGIGYFPKRISEEVKKLGGKIRVKSIVTKLEVKKDHYVVNYLNNHKLHKINADFVVSTIPLDILSKMIFPLAPKKVLEVGNKLKYLAVLVVNLLVNKPKLNDSSWIYYPDEDLIFNYILEFKNWSKKMVKPRKTSLSVNVTCHVGDEIWKLSDKELLKKTIEDLEKVNILDKTDVFDGFVDRLPYAYPIYNVNYKKQLSALHKYFKTFKNFYLSGRTGNFEYVNSDKVMESALELADKIILDLNK